MIDEFESIGEIEAWEAQRIVAPDFWEKVDIRDQRECWRWTGLLGSYGYGIVPTRIASAFGTRLSHRVACIFAYPWRPADRSHVLHSCDNPACCNPRHLRWGNPLDNCGDRAIAAWATVAAEAQALGQPVPLISDVRLPGGRRRRAS